LKYKRKVLWKIVSEEMKKRSMVEFDGFLKCILKMWAWYGEYRDVCTIVVL
jgi:hypothetical protein